MECTQSSASIHKTLVLFLLLSNSIFLASADDRRTYIVHLRPKSTSFFGSALEKIKWYESLLPIKSQLLYSYNKIINGFAARLSSEELAVLKLVDGFLQAIPDATLELQTTHSPMFLGLTPNTSGVWPDANFGKSIIIGVLDTGIKVGHPSFSDNGLLPSPPTKWKGSCEFNPSDCNNKLIGTKAFINGTQGGAPYDDVGHGTHVASTAAGMFVDGANVYGQAIGTAAGMAPYAHIAMYKVCDANGCRFSDVLAGLESAIEDGVDIVSLSLSRNSNTPPSPFYQDLTAIGTGSGRGLLEASAKNQDRRPSCISSSINTAGSYQLHSLQLTSRDYMKDYREESHRDLPQDSLDGERNRRSCLLLQRNRSQEQIGEHESSL